MTGISAGLLTLNLVAERGLYSLDPKKYTAAWVLQRVSKDINRMIDHLLDEFGAFGYRMN